MLDVDESEWFGGVKEHALASGYAKNARKLEKDPDAYSGTVGDFMMVLRVAVTGSRRSPSLHGIVSILGTDAVASRIDRALEHVSRV